MSGHEDEQLQRLTDEQLLEKAREGDGKAYAMFCVRALPTLQRYLRHQCRAMNIAPDLANDFAQETLLHALRSARREKGDQGAPQVMRAISIPWLFRIGLNVVIDYCVIHS